MAFRLEASGLDRELATAVLQEAGLLLAAYARGLPTALECFTSGSPKSVGLKRLETP